MAKSSHITIDEWLAECEMLERENADEGETIEEYARRVGIGVEKARKHMREAQREGRLQVGRRPAVSLTGANYKQVVYSIKPKGAASNGQKQKK